MRRCFCFVFLLLICLVLPNAQAAEEGTDILLSFTGDCTLGSEERTRWQPTSFDSYIEQHGYAYPFEKVQSVLAQDDVTVINLENVFYPFKSNRAQKTYTFRGPPEFAQILTEGSVELSYLGNNHTNDYGVPGFRSTVRTLEEGGHNWFATTDHSVKTWIYEKNGVRVGFTGCYLTYYNRRQEDVKKGFEELKAQGCDFIVAVMHGGQEYGPRQDKRMQRLARFLVDQGAGLVVGHHPHVLHGVEVYNQATILYSLGNFSFGGNKELRVTQTMIAQAKLRFDAQGTYAGHQVNLIPAYPSGTMDYNNYQPVLAGGAEAQAIIDLVATMSTIPLSPYVEGVGAWQEPVLPAQPD